MPNPSATLRPSGTRTGGTPSSRKATLRSNAPAPPAKPTATIAAGTGLQAILTFSKAMLATASLTATSTYTITTVSGTPIQLGSVQVLSPVSVALQFQSPTDTVGSYTVSIPASTLYSSDLAAMDATSSPFSLSVTGISPRVLAVIGTPDLTHVSVTFSKAMDPTTSTAAANYSVSGGVSVVSVTRTSDVSVVLEISGAVPGTSYNLTPSSSITDAAGNHLV